MNAWESLSAFALPVALGGVFVSSVVLASAWLLRRRSEPLRYGVLFAGVIGLLAAPVLVGIVKSFPDTVAWPEPPPVEEIVRVPAEMLPELLDESAAEAPAVATSTPMGPFIGATLLSIWAVVTSAGLARLAFALWKQGRSLVGRPWQAEFWTDTLKAHLAAKLGLRKFPGVHASPAAPMPMVIGLFRPTIVLPEASPVSWQQGQWEAVLLHEAAHIARRDQWAVLAQHLAILLFWWCPLVHVIGRRLSELRENICDDCALQGPCDQVAYAELLVESAERFLDLKPTPVQLALLDSARGGLEARVTRLLEKERKPMTRLTFAGKLLGAGCLVAACVLTTAATAFSQAQPQPPRKVQIKILIDGKEIDLSDLQIHLDALHKKPAPIPAAGGADTGGVRPAPHAGLIKEVAFSPDGKLLITSDGKIIQMVDVATGKVIAKFDHGTDSKKAIELVYGVPGLPGAGAKDPRIEAIVEQAEKIKPGSGADVRKALEGKKTTAASDLYSDYRKAIEAYAKAESLGTRKVEAKGGKKIIIIIEDGKVQQLTEQDLKKLLDKDAWYRIERKTTETKKTEAKPMALPTPILPAKAPVPPGTKAPPVPPVPPTPASPDVDALRRQLERLNAELQELRKRLETGKK